MRTDDLALPPYATLLHHLNAMEESLRRKDEVLYAKDYYKKLCNEAFIKAKAELPP